MHSLHAYFLRRGDFKAPIVYQVDRSLDGHSFANRRVVAIQHGEPIFNMAASFQVLEEGLEHQLAMPAVPQPEELSDSSRPPPELLALAQGAAALPRAAAAVRVPAGAAVRLRRAAERAALAPGVVSGGGPPAAG